MPIELLRSPLRSIRAWTLPAVLGVAMTAGCGAPPTASENGPPAVELRTYSIPAGYESQVPSMLRAALHGDEGIGRVSVGPGGSVLVLAPAGVQRGVAEFLTELEKAGPAPTGPAPVVMTYWMVLGAPDATVDGFEVEGPRSLREVLPALEQIAASQGSQRFKLLERIELTSVGEEWAHSNGRHTRVQQRATLIQGVVLADIQLSLSGPSLQTQVRLEPEQLLVLAQTGVGPRPSWEQDGSEFVGEDLYYIVTTRIE